MPVARYPFKGRKFVSPGTRSAISTTLFFYFKGDPFFAQESGKCWESETGSKCEQPFDTTMGAGDVFMVSQEHSLVAMDTLCVSVGSRANTVASNDTEFQE